MRALILAALLTLAAAPPKPLMIGSEAFPQSDIVDARAIADATGMPAVMITLSPGAAARLAALTATNIGKPLPITLGGKHLMTPIVSAAITQGELQISGNLTFDSATALARQISGKEPLPESTDE